MKSISDALVYSVIYINNREDPEEEFIDDDVDALESVAAILRSATEEEKNELAAAAERGLAEEKDMDPLVNPLSKTTASGWNTCSGKTNGRGINESNVGGTCKSL